MTGYAPLGSRDDPAPVCGFCGEVGGPDGVLVTVGMHGGTICVECAVKVAQVMTRRGRPPESLPTDPRDPGRPIAVDIDQQPLGDLGNPRVDARLLLAIALRDSSVADWLRERGVDEAAIRAEFGELELGW
jgi:hypothetical protein